MNFEEIVQKAVNVKAKAGLRSTIMIWDSNICCPRGYYLFNNTASKVQTQETIAKDFSRPEKSKIKDSKSVPPCDGLAEPAKKENKQKKFKHQRKYTKEPKKTSAISNNIVNAVKKKKKHNTNKITYFKYNKKSHYASNCTKPKN